MNWSAAIAASVFLVSGPQAQQPDAQLLAAFGLEFHKPLAFPECARRKDVVVGVAVYLPPTSLPCYEHLGERRGPIFNEAVRITWPTPTQPKIARGAVMARIVGGTLESVLVPTGGVVTQENDLKLLRKKLGAPGQFERRSGQDSFGARVQQISAVWRFTDGGHVTLLGATPDGHGKMSTRAGAVI